MGSFSVLFHVARPIAFVSLGSSCLRGLSMAFGSSKSGLLVVLACGFLAESSYALSRGCIC